MAWLTMQRALWRGPEPEGPEHGQVVAALADGRDQCVAQGGQAQDHEKGGEVPGQAADVARQLDVRRRLCGLHTAVAPLELTDQRRRRHLGGR